MSVPADFLKFVDDNADKFIARLKTAVAFKSVSGDPTLQTEVNKMADFLVSQLQTVGATVRKVPIKGKEVDYPSAILAEVHSGASKKTILCYGHYDVQPAQEKGWNTNPFELTEIDGKLYGRGSTDDKGPVCGWINVLQAHKELNIPLPVNLKLCLEGKEESGTEEYGPLLDNLILTDEFFKGVSAVCISDSYWLSTTKPCLTYGLRGILYFELSISGPTRDLHSGEYGGMVYEPMTILFHLMSKLVTIDAKIPIEKVNALVAPLTPAEEEHYRSLTYNIQDDLTDDIGSVAVSNDKATLLMNRMRFPSLSLHGIKNASGDETSATVIPSNPVGKFSIRLVPNQDDPQEVAKDVTCYIRDEYDKLDIKSTQTKWDLKVVGSGPPWTADTNHWNYVAGQKATKAVYNQDPDFTREGGSIPITFTFQKLGDGNTNVLLLPMGRSDDGAHSTNEKLDRSNFINGTKLMGTYLYEAAVAQT